MKTMTDKGPSLREAAQMALDALVESVEDSREMANTFITSYGANYRPERLATLRKTVSDGEVAISNLTDALALPDAEPVQPTAQQMREYAEARVLADRTARQVEQGQLAWMQNIDVAMQEPLFHELRGVMGTENTGQDIALLQTLRRYRAKALHAPVERKPLTRKQVQDIVIGVCDEIYPQEGGSYSEADAVFYSAFAHAIEQAHNIQGAA